MMGIQLTGLLLAGTGAAWLVAVICGPVDRVTGGRALTWRRASARSELARGVAGCAAAILVLAPAWRQLRAYDLHDAVAIQSQRRADATQSAQLDRLIGRIKADGGGRVYAGMPTNWGMDFTVGAVPVFKYLASHDVDEVGYTLRTASLMTDPEDFFDEAKPSDYSALRPPLRDRPVRRPPSRAGTTHPAGRRVLAMDVEHGGLRPSRQDRRRSHGRPGRTSASEASRSWSPGSRNRATTSGSSSAGPAVPISVCRRRPSSPAPGR